MVSVNLAGGKLISTPPIRAAQYVRMSTEHQQYSTLNQRANLQAYAVEHGIHIVRTYADEGKSGLRLHGRPALGQLINDVVSGSADFSLILVYDVSRWGRFQDADEAAHYEFLCRQAGINVEYCAEQFENDGSPVGALLKGMKRIMAAEYSRELSAKVHFAQSRIARSGYLVGGQASFGFRRLTIDKLGNPRGILENGEQKAITTDRILLVPGPAEEVQLVRWIFNECASGKSVRSIATTLNARGIPTPRGKEWANPTLASLLRNEKYIGNSIWNKKSYKLRAKTVRNAPEHWIRVDGAFEPIISRSLFEKVQKVVAARKEARPEQELLDALKRLLARKGRLTREIIRTDRHTPGLATYDERFGGLAKAYKRIGYTPQRIHDLDTYRRFRKIARRHAVEMVERLRRNGRTVNFQSTKSAITVGSEIRILFMILRCVKTETGTVYWQLYPNIVTRTHIVVGMRMKVGNRSVHDYLLIPGDELRNTALRINDHYAHPFVIYRSDTLEPLFTMLMRRDMTDAPMRERILTAIEYEDQTRPWWRRDGK